MTNLTGVHTGNVCLGQERRWRLFYTQSGPTRDYNTAAGQVRTTGVAQPYGGYEGTVDSLSGRLYSCSPCSIA